MVCAMKTRLLTLLASLFLASLLPAQISTPGKLSVYFIDVEGGQATLFVTPQKHSLLIDTGWNGHNFRDADRIAAVAHAAGLTRLDFVLITHYHDDHVGGVPQLVARIPVGTFIDHGPNRKLTPDVNANYSEFLHTIATNRIQEIVAKPGDLLPIPELQVRVISADGNLIDKPLEGAGKLNPFCKSSEIKPPDQTENARSLGVEITFGRLRILDLGDLTWDKEMQLMCPANRLGSVDVLVVSHHGWNQSSSPALVEALHARVAIMDNGAEKGGSIPTFKTLAAAPGLEQLWQLHYSNEAKELNQPDKFIANPQGPDAANFLKLTAGRDGGFSVMDSRTGFLQSYAAK
jgi:beta-lactamase superfamily II metal-dependent hydrolase